MTIAIILATAPILASATIHGYSVDQGFVTVSQTPAQHALAAHTYEARIRLGGRVSTTQVRAGDAGHAKKLVQAQFPTATVLSVKRVD